MSVVRREEVPHNTPEQVRRYLEDALELVEALEVPDDLRVAAFGKAVDLLAAKQLMLTQPPPLGVGAMGIPGVRQ